VTIELIRADSPEINLRAIDAATIKLASAVTDPDACRWCAARNLLREIEDFGRDRCLHGSAARGLIAHAKRVLESEPRLNTTCRACRGRRRLARSGELPGCPTHATCRECRPRQTGGVH
jgi:hypothetical protein